MGGELQVESKVGSGSRFFFTLPLKPPTQTPSASGRKPSIVRVAKGKPVKALVADDVAENRDVLAQILTAIGVEVETAVDGVDALEKIRTFNPDIAFIDIRMPRLDGMGVVQQILEEFPRTRPKLVAFSASAMLHQRQHFLDAGFDAFLSKPIEAAKGYDVLATLLRGDTGESLFEYAEEESVIDFGHVELPQPLLSQLIEAAEFGGVSELEGLIDTVRQQGGPAEALANVLLVHCRDLDFPTITEVLEQLLGET